MSGWEVGGRRSAGQMGGSLFVPWIVITLMTALCVAGAITLVDLTKQSIPPATASAYLAQNYASGGYQHVAVLVDVGSMVGSASLYGVLVNVTLANGTAVSLALPAYLGAANTSGPVTVTLLQPASSPSYAVSYRYNELQSLYVSITAPAASPVRSVSVTLMYVTPWGETFNVTTNIVSVPRAGG